MVEFHRGGSATNGATPSTLKVNATQFNAQMQPNPKKCPNITRNVLGCKTLGEILSERHAIANNIKVGLWIDQRTTEKVKAKIRNLLYFSQVKITEYLN